MEKTKYFGVYNGKGYEIVSEYGRAVIYQAGNHLYDSGQYLPEGAQGTASVEQLRRWCEQIGKEISQENCARWSGAQFFKEYLSNK